MDIVVDERRCIGCGACEEFCPKVFRLGERKVAVVSAPPDESLGPCVAEAAASCPQGAIRLAAETGGAG